MTAAATKLQRSSGTVRLSFKTRGAKTDVDALFQDGCSKVRFPADPGQDTSEAVLINTSGGLTDGDFLSCAVDWGRNTTALVSTQAAERIYRSRGGSAIIETTLNVAAGATACWLPQETIVFDGGRLDRKTVVDLSTGAELFAAESAVFGRTAMGEVPHLGRLSERWDVRVDGKLVFADATLFDDTVHGDLGRHLARASIANGAHCIATVICMGDGLESLRDAMREIISGSSVVAGVSIPGPLVVARLLATDSNELRNLVAQLFEASQSFALPRVWQC